MPTARELELYSYRQPIAYLSKAHNPKNIVLSVYEKELVTIIMALTRWKHYLVGYNFIIKTDHQSLKFLLEQKITTTLQHKCLTKLLGLDYEILYKKGVTKQGGRCIVKKRFRRRR